MDAFDIGDTVPLTYNLYAPDGTTPVDATVSLTVTVPDGSISSPAVTHAATGVYTASYSPTVAGTFRFRFTATGARTDAAEGAFTVRRQGSQVVLLDEFKRHLNKTVGTITADDGELQDFLDTATEAAGVILGFELGTRTVTETQTVRCADTIVLRQYPVSSVTAVSVLPYLGGTATDYTASDVTASQSGILRLNSGLRWTGDVTVTYVAGQSDVRIRWITAIKIIGAHLWKTQRGSGSGRPNVGVPQDPDGLTLVPELGYAIPNAALALLTHDPGGVAIA